MTEDFKIKTTEDGSSTLYFPEYDEYTHTIHGAYTEALYKHVIPSGILDRRGHLVVIDVGFGLGYNLLALLNSIDLNRIDGLKIFSFEMEKAIGPYLDQLKIPAEQQDSFNWIREAFDTGSFHGGNLEITMLWGDARQSIKKLQEFRGGTSAVFLDPHSPGKNSELWTVDFFNKLYDLMDEKANLTTYSKAPQVRGGLLEAGFRISPLFSEQFKKEGTLASKSALPNEIKREIILQNIKTTAYRDNRAMDLPREIIRENRIITMAEKRKLLKLKEGTD